MMLIGLMFSAFLLGLAGGLHCLAMCGGLCSAMGRPSAQEPFHGISAARALQIGRVLGYTLAGALAGGLVQTVAWASEHAVIFKPAWVMLHAAMLAWGLILFFFARQPLWAQSVAGPTWKRLDWVKASSRRSIFLGMGWVILPCGLLYSALLIAGLSGGIWQGAAVMLAFVMPTVAWLLGAHWLIGHLSLVRDARTQQWARRLAGLALAAGAAWALWQHAAHGIQTIC
ncbi:sulfite exporter TauE/SafE family protein [Variovorax sp. PCZ-1]|uniref:sulfite exporter TauE/SafE family protein n=1 Tax=Variovorax sp. PCZ-1 TaxID=2835533 RepID=UPI001BCD8973|nr:sulfite exporter TauE/SafE family protein [Variovorax sp. PCZ-1]MBS7807709.1 sulfite exporter TauE/SafE family protein [Variovorax sp. PCZ-1]